MTHETLAKRIASDVAGSNVMQFDPMLIVAIIQILTQLLPLIEDCELWDRNDPVESVNRLVHGRFSRWRRWRLRRIVRQHLGPDMDPDMINEVAEAIIDRGLKEETWN